MHTHRKFEMAKGNGGKDFSLWDPLHERYGIRGTLSRLFEDVFHGLERAGWGPGFAGMELWTPSVDVEEKDKEYLLTADLPGLDKKDIRVEVKNKVLTISGERKTDKEEKGKNYLRREHTFGSFSRSLSLPEDTKATEIKASYKDGVLSLKIPRVEGAQAQAAKIAIE